MARILWIGDAGSHGGFATVTHAIGERLVKDYGHDIHVLAANYLGDHWDTNLKLYPASQKVPKDVVGMSRVAEMLARVMPDAVVFINDPRVVLRVLRENQWDTEQVLWRGMAASSGFRYKPPIIGYLAIDGYNSPRLWDELLPRVTRVAMSHHGQDTMPEAPVIWHGVDTEVFQPRDKRAAKAALGFDPDRFLVLRVDKNTWRKDYPSTWKALRPVLRQYEDIDVHFHCRQDAPDGYDLNAVRYNDEDIRDRVTTMPEIGGLGRFTGIPIQQLAMLYNAADVFVSTSWGEGFGLTILEALASGTPVIAQKCSAITEVVGDGGILIEPKGMMHVPMGQEHCVPDVDRFTYWIRKVYESQKLREDLGAKAVAQAKRCSWDEAARRMHGIIEDRIQAEAEALKTNAAPAEAEAVAVGSQ